MTTLENPDGIIPYRGPIPIGEPPLFDFRTSAATGALAAAVAGARAKMGNIKKTAENPFFKSHYADLGAIVTEMAPLFAAGVMVFQSPGGFDPDTKTIRVHTRVTHSSGEWMHTWMSMPVGKSASPQDQGSAITYARRYALQAMLCLAAEDDDGNASSGRVSPAIRPPEDPRTATEPGWMTAIPAAEAMKDAPPDDTEVKQEATYRAYEKQLLECPDLSHLAATWSAATKAKKANLLTAAQLKNLGHLKDTSKESLQAEEALAPKERGDAGVDG
jgi:hypothetical protein